MAFRVMCVSRLYERSNKGQLIWEIESEVRMHRCCPDPGVFMKCMMFLQLQAVGLLDGGGSYPKCPGGLLRPVRLPREVLWAKGHAFRV